MKQSKPTRRKVQNTNRSANKFGLQPFVPALTLTAQQYVSGMAEHVRGTLAVVADTVPNDAIFDIDALTVEGQNALVDALNAIPVPDDLVERIKAGTFAKLDKLAVRTKPKGSNAWPHNKKLACCGQTEKNCTCGSDRVYYYEEVDA